MSTISHLTKKIQPVIEKIALGRIEDVIDTIDNTPLTLDKLRTMEGKPIWVEVYDPIDENKGWHIASWKLIEYINDEYFDVRSSDGEQDCFFKSENDWQAYRKER